MEGKDKMTDFIMFLVKSTIFKLKNILRDKCSYFSTSLNLVRNLSVLQK